MLNTMSVFQLHDGSLSVSAARPDAGLQEENKLGSSGLESGFLGLGLRLRSVSGLRI